MSRLILLTLGAMVAALCQEEGPRKPVRILAGKPYGVRAGASVSPRPYSGGGTTEVLQEIATHLDLGKLRTLSPGSWESAVLEAAKRSAEVTLTLPLEAAVLSGFYTQPSNDGDILVARWTPPNGAHERAVWLWDTPFETVFIAEVKSDLLQPPVFASYVNNFVRFRQRPLDIDWIECSYLDRRPGLEQILTSGVNAVETSRGGTNLWLMALAKGQSGMVGIGFSKPMLYSYYPMEAYRIHERFPPLGERLAKAGKQALWDEFDSMPAVKRHRDDAVVRARIFMNEIVKRGPLSEAEVRRLLVGRYDSGDFQSGVELDRRAWAFVLAVKEKKDLAAYGPVLERIYRDVPIHGAAPNPVGKVFQAMEKQGLDYSYAALSFLEHHVHISGSLSYLKRNGHTPETLERLSRIVVTPKFENAKHAAIEEIRIRMAVR